MQQINIDELKPHPRNNEFFDDMTGEKWSEFLESIRTSGVIEPIVVTTDMVIVSGHQRVRACKELGIPEGTIHTWLKAVRTGQLDIGDGSHTPESAMSLAEELTMLRKRVKDQDKEIRRLKDENEFLEEASAFFAASRRKSLRPKE